MMVQCLVLKTFQLPSVSPHFEMSAVLPAQKILTMSTNFYKIPGVQTWGVPDLIPAAHSGDAPSVSSTASTSYRNIDREEPCFITKSSCYTHERNAVRSDPEVKEEVVRWPLMPLTTGVFLQEDLLRKRAIVYPNFVLDSVVNLSNCMLIFLLITFNFQVHS
jgi:hypothetical protein